MTLCFRCRRLFFLFTYFMFFYYIFIAIFHSILRILASVIFGTFLLPRIDYSVLPRKCQIIDLGKCFFFLYRYIIPAYIIGFENYNINKLTGIDVFFYVHRIFCILWIFALREFPYQPHCNGVHFDIASWISTLTDRKETLWKRLWNVFRYMIVVWNQCLCEFDYMIFQKS